MGLSWYNCISFGNGLESDRIRDDFNAMTITNGVKASSTIEQPYQEERRGSGLIYSGLYNTTSGINNLNQFIMAEKITKDLNPTYGSIQKLFQRRSSASYGDTLIAFCEDRVIGITSNKDALYNADGKPQLISTNAVLGDANPFVGDYGISKNPESFAKESYRAYFTDKQRGAVLRLSMDGLTPISDAGMRDYFRDNLKTASKLIGTFDEYKKDYNLTLSRYLPENLITNSSVGEAQSLIEYTLPDDFLENGNFVIATDYTTPSQPLNGLLNSTFEIETNIVNHAEILEGQFQPEVTAVPALPSATIPAQIPVFALGTAQNIYEWKEADSNTTSTYILPTEQQNQTGGYGPNGINSGGTAGGSPYGVPWYTSDDHDWWQNTNGRIEMHDAESNEYCYADLTQLQSNSDYTTTFDLNGVTTTIGYNVPSTFNTSHTESGQTLYTAESIRTRHPDARDNTVFYGEEISVDFNTGITHNKDYYKPKIVLIDGDTGLQVSNSIIHIPVCFPGYPTGNTCDAWDQKTHFDPDAGQAPNHGGGANANWADLKDNIYEYPGTSTGNHSNVGFVSGSSYTWPTWWEGSNANQGGARWFRVCFKFGTSQSSSTTGIAVRNLLVRIYDVEGGGYDQAHIKAFQIKKRYQWTTPDAAEIPVGTVVPAVAAQPAIPPSTISQWVEVDHTVDAWNSTGTYPTHDWKLREVAEATYGPHLPSQIMTATATYDQGSYVTGDTITWIEPQSGFSSSGNTPSFNQYADGIQISDGYANKHDDTQSGDLTQDLTLSGGFGSLIGDNWYELTCTYTGSPSGTTFISNILDSGTTASSTPSGYIGVVSSDSISLIMQDDGQGNLKARWKQSTQNSSSFDELKISGQLSSVVIDNIELRDISTGPLGGDVGSIGNSEYWNLSGNMDIRNYYAYKNIYQDSGKVIWVNGGGLRSEPDGDGTQEDQSLSQVFGSFNDATNTLPPTMDGYSLDFTISDYTSGELEGYVHGAGVSDGSGGYIAQGFNFSGINADGNWSIVGNTDGTALSIKKDDVATGSINGDTDVVDQNDMNKVLFNASVSNANSSSPFNGSISNIVIRDITNYFIGGDVDNWVISGFDKTIYDYILWRSTEKYLEFNNAPEESTVDGVLTPLTVRQNINRNFYEGETYRLKFNITSYVGSGAIRGYFYNHLGKGFTFEVDNSNFISSDSYYFNQQFIIGDDDSAATDNSILRGMFVIIVDSGPFTANLDDFVLQQEFPNYVPTTITYNEDVKGWVSFKSFVPEGGLSVSNNYYTFRNGGLFQHHINDVRNWFYGDLNQDGNPKIVESSLTAVINQEPSLIKIFNTLNYEGSQSKVDKYITDATTGLTNVGVYNLNEKNGWYVDHIKTDKQDGDLSEFVEKEGKWFNYIRGKDNGIDTAALSFQGLGTVSSTIESSE